MRSRRTLAGIAILSVAIVYLVYAVGLGESSVSPLALPAKGLNEEAEPVTLNFGLKAPTPEPRTSSADSGESLDHNESDPSGTSGERQPLPPAGDRAVLRIELVNAEDGQPLVDCGVTCAVLDSEGSETEFDCLTLRPKFENSWGNDWDATLVDERGAIEFDVASNVPLYLSVFTSHHYSNYHGEEVPALGPGEVRTHRISLRRFRAIYLKGHVVDPDGDVLKVSGFEVTVSAGSAGESFSEPLSDGEFSLGPLPADTYSISADPVGLEEYARSESIEVDGTEEEIVLRLRRAGRFKLSVDQPPGPSNRFTCSFTREAGDFVSERTLEDRAISLAGLVPGEYSVSVWGYGKFGYRRGITVIEGESAAEVEVSLSEAAMLRFVYQSDETPIYRVTQNGQIVRFGRAANGEVILVPSGPLEIQKGWTVESSSHQRQYMDAKAGEVVEVNID